MKPSRIKPRVPTKEEKLVTFGFLNAQIERLDQLISTLEGLIEGTTSAEHRKALEGMRVQRKAMASVADWIYPR